MKIKLRITNQGRIGGFKAEVQKDGHWVAVTKYIGGGLVSFDSREQAIKAATAEAKLMVRAK